jgi:superfamily II DNA or RNA helicase
MTGNDLMEQWEQSLRTTLTSVLGITLVRGFGGQREEERFLLSPKGKILLCSRQNLKHLVKQMGQMSGLPRMAIVHDEVHDLGSLGNRIGLEGHGALFVYRFGMSATPEREYDQEGNTFIERELGPVLFRYELEDAIKDRVLCPFDYFAIPYRLTADDKSDLKAVYTRKAAAEKEGHPWPNEQLWIELSRVYKKARLKPSAFGTFLDNHAHEGILESTIVFLEDKEFADRVFPILIKHTHLFSRYFDTDSSEILANFARGDIGCLVTCHKLSQGIDLPWLRNVVVFSSQRGRRETIQRLGRCLRMNSLVDPDKVARVMDFRLVADDETLIPDGYDEDRVTWLTKLSQVRPL